MYYIKYKMKQDVVIKNSNLYKLGASPEILAENVDEFDQKLVT